jgi:hypothetical protein
MDNVDVFCLWTYVVVDEVWQRIAPLFHRPFASLKHGNGERTLPPSPG